MTSPKTVRPPSCPRRRHLLRLAAALAATAVFSAGGAPAWNKFAGEKSQSEGYQIAVVQRGDIEDLVTATGVLQPRDFVEVGAQVSGQITKIHVEVGSEVKAGDLLAEIDATVFSARVDATRAQLRSQRAQLEERRSQLALAEIQHARQTTLFAENATTKDALQVAEASVRSARAQIEALSAQIDQSESTLRAEEATLRYARIYAPMSGTIVSVTARQGQTINASQQAPVILRIADLSTMTVQTQVSEADVGKLRIGMEAYFTTLGSQGRRWHGTLRKVEPTPEVQNNVVLYNALFDVPNSNNALMTQMTAQVFFVSASARDALLVPISALSLSTRGERQMRGERQGREGRPEEARREGRSRQGDGGGAPSEGPPPRRGVARVVLSDGGIEEREVLVGVGNRIQAEILSGLKEGDRIVAGTRPAARPQSSGPPSGMGGMGGMGAVPSGPRLR
ncbi:efflux RND transporter periplasmic adaptor subunit [Geoalkalibacter halelectricus]|uniref:efflux RND transporter periplasmic adaptor subunit n=1 Tax=Geoalkalibacter halelectricus TaxID=2847045 RepID=UPI0026705498|nr:efflux RND transporter periplasmic adaptor subunit [Geoalkalibacter halelectricus]MDO3380326.1 efflux RND transporter periplasmic adaptor subunit [Geoalkalibacter halelectricus]